MTNPADDALQLVLREILTEVRGLRRDLQRRSGLDPRALLDAIEDSFGPGRFTAAGLLAMADEEPHSPLGTALAGIIDMDASPRGRVTALGIALAKLPELEVVASQRGCAVEEPSWLFYRLRTLPDKVR